MGRLKDILFNPELSAAVINWRLNTVKSLMTMPMARMTITVA